MQEQLQEGEKYGFLYTCAEYYYFAAKHSWTALRMGRPLFVDSYSQVTWWALGHEKKEKFASNDDNCFDHKHLSFFPQSHVQQAKK